MLSVLQVLGKLSYQCRPSLVYLAVLLYGVDTFGGDFRVPQLILEVIVFLP